ncbi:hypothetical protein LCGC14_3118600, partial [marine sediment metagenome]
MTMQTGLRDLGEIEGKVLLFGGPYSNLQATQALIAEAQARGIAPANAICTGDLVAYGADPVATARAVMSWGAAVVAGNCERQLAEVAPDCGCGFDAGSACDLLSKGWYPYAAARVSDELRRSFAALPDMIRFDHAGRRYAVLHGGARDNSRFVWPDAPDAVFADERHAVEAVAGPVDAIIAGHCGIAFQRHAAGIDWINPGVIGLPPHDGRPMTRFGLLDADG